MNWTGHQCQSIPLAYILHQTKGASYCYLHLSNMYVHLFDVKLPLWGICPPPNSHVAHVALESRGTHNTN